jgi:hypothetical protein
MFTPWLLSGSFIKQKVCVVSHETVFLGTRSFKKSFKKVLIFFKLVVGPGGEGRVFGENRAAPG